MDAMNFFENGETEYLNGRFEEAIQDCDESIKLNPNYAPAYYIRGSAKIGLGKNEEAIIDFDKAIELNPAYAHAYINRGTAKYFLQKYEEAIRDFDEAIELDPRLDEAYSGRGNAKLELGKHEAALLDFTKAVELKPESHIYLQNRSNAQQQKQIVEYKKDLEAQYRYENEKLNSENRKLEAEIEELKTEKNSKQLKDMGALFKKEEEFYTDKSRKFFKWVVGILFVIIGISLGIVITLFVKEKALSMSISEHINLYLWMLPLVVLEALFFFIYSKADRLVHFYRHKIAVIGSLEYVLENHDDKYLEKYDDFKLQQYAKLYEPPLFIGEVSAKVSNDGFSFKNKESGK